LLEKILPLRFNEKFYKAMIKTIKVAKFRKNVTINTNGRIRKINTLFFDEEARQIAFK